MLLVHQEVDRIDLYIENHILSQIERIGWDTTVILILIEKFVRKL